MAIVRPIRIGSTAPYYKGRAFFMKQAQLEGIAERYAAFARDEARGSSAAYERLALAVASSDDLLKFIATLPSEKRQPNLFLAAVRHVCGVPRSIDDLTQFVRARQVEIRQVMLSRTTQTNEPARCAVLLPLLAQLTQPLALLEVAPLRAYACFWITMGTTTEMCELIEPYRAIVARRCLPVRFPAELPYLIDPSDCVARWIGPQSSRCEIGA